MNFCCLNPGEVSVGPASMAGLGAAGRSGIALALKGEGEFWAAFPGESPGGFFPSAGLSLSQEVRKRGRLHSANPRVHEQRELIARCIIPGQDRSRGREVHKTRRAGKERRRPRLLQCRWKMPVGGRPLDDPGPYEKISLTTLPPSGPVRRWRRPWWGKVNLSCSSPSRCRTVAWRSRK